MRASLRAGLLLTAAALLLVIISHGLSLEIESYAVSGIATGAVIGLVTDRSPWARVLAFTAGFVAAFVGYALRALVFPDNTEGLAAGVVVTLALCVAFAAAGAGRYLPLWAILLGAGSFCGVYERPFTAAVPEMATTSIDVASSLLLSVGVGFVVASLAAARPAAAPVPAPPAAPTPTDAEPAEVAL